MEVELGELVVAWQHADFYRFRYSRIRRAQSVRDVCPWRRTTGLDKNYGRCDVQRQYLRHFGRAAIPSAPVGGGCDKPDWRRILPDPGPFRSACGRSPSLQIRKAISPNRKMNINPRRMKAKIAGILLWRNKSHNHALQLTPEPRGGSGAAKLHR